MMLADEDFRLTDQTVQRMIDLLRDGISADFIAQGLKFHHLHPSLVHYVKGPLLRSANNLAPEPAWLRIVTQIERLEAVIAEHRAGAVEQLATYADVMAYLYPGAQTRLLHPTWTTINSHVAGVILAQHKLGSDENLPAPGNQAVGLTAGEESQLMELRQEIRQTVVRLARQWEITWPGRPGSVSADRLSFQQLALRSAWKKQPLEINAEGTQRCPRNGNVNPAADHRPGTPRSLNPAACRRPGCRPTGRWPTPASRRQVQIPPQPSQKSSSSS